MFRLDYFFYGDIKYYILDWLIHAQQYAETYSF